MRSDTVRKKRSAEVEAGSGNVFADLGVPDAMELDTRVRLAVAINQPKVSALKNYRLEGFSVERLMGFLTALGSDIEIRICSSKRTPGQIRVEAA